MSSDRRVNANELLGKARLSISEMTDLIAAMVSDLPTVRSIAVDDQGAEISVHLVTGKRIGIAAIPVAHVMNESMNARLQALDDLFKRCA